jgi:hypothetical protein
MPVDLYWDDDDQTVLLCEFNGAWTWDELQKVLKTTKRLAEERGRVLGALVDVRQSASVPGGSIFNRAALSQFQQMLQLGAGGKGPVVIVGMNGMIRAIVETIRSIDQNAVNDVHFADTMPAAQQIIYGIMRRLNDAAG